MKKIHTFLKGKETVNRMDLKRIYRYGEYNKAVSYAEQNRHVAGVENYVQLLRTEKEKYSQELKAIVEPEIEQENAKYTSWQKWFKKKMICIRIMAGLLSFVIVSLLLSIFVDSNGFMHVINWLKWFCLFWMIIMIPVLTVMKIGDVITANIYRKYSNSLMKKISDRNNLFTARSQEIYREIDNCYLVSLDPSHREMVLMRREQARHQGEMRRLEEQRVRVEREKLMEERRARMAQESLLDIEQERKKREDEYYNRRKRF